MDFSRFVYRFVHRFSSKLVSPFSSRDLLLTRTPPHPNPTIIKTWPFGMRARDMNQNILKLDPGKAFLKCGQQQIHLEHSPGYSPY